VKLILANIINSFHKKHFQIEKIQNLHKGQYYKNISAEVLSIRNLRAASF
jgi:hypothetical protein